MPEYPWQLDGWEARKKATWPLEWSQDIADQPGVVHRYRLIHKEGRGWIRQGHGKGGRWGFDEAVTDHEAACLIDNFLTTWLRMRDVLLHPSLHRGDFLVKRWSPTGQGGWLLGEGGWHDTGVEAKSARFATEREAIAAAVDAVLAEKEKGDG